MGGNTWLSFCMDFDRTVTGVTCRRVGNSKTAKGKPTPAWETTHRSYAPVQLIGSAAECPLSQSLVSAYNTSGSRLLNPACFMSFLNHACLPPAFRQGNVFNPEKITAKHPVESILDF